MQAFPNSSGMKGVFVKLGFRDGLVWTVGLTRRNRAALTNQCSRGSVGPKLSLMSILCSRPFNSYRILASVSRVSLAALFIYFFWCFFKTT